MKRRLGKMDDAGSPHQLHDYAIFKSHEDVLMKRYYDNKNKVAEHVQAILPGLNLSGQWSIDIMQNGNEFWIIDMAVAENSAFYDCVPKTLRRTTIENWIPAIQ